MNPDAALPDLTALLDDALVSAFLENVPDLVYFKDHESDPVFFVDQFDHIGSKGWWYYNKAIDDFFHDRLHPKQITAKTDRI